MIGATVMPHNLYLHSALVQSRNFPQTISGKKLACKYNLIDSAIALNGAFFINAAILVLAAATFYGTPDRPEGVEQLQDAHLLLEQALGTSVDPFLMRTLGITLSSGVFAIALLASGQSSTLTGTLAGQVVMEGFVHLHLRPWLRRLITRSVAIVPALIVIAWAGHDSADDGKQTDSLLFQLMILSQAILSFQLPFAIVPLIQFTSDRRRMGEFTNRAWLALLAWLSAAIVIGLNFVSIYLLMQEWAGKLEENGRSQWWIYGTLGPVSAGIAFFLGWVSIYPYWRKHEVTRQPVAVPVLPTVHYQRIGVAVEFSKADSIVLTQAASLARTHGAMLVLAHVVEGLAAAYYGPEADDRESRDDRARMADLVNHLREEGLNADGFLGYGSPPEELVRIAQEQHIDLLVLGTHGHRFFADLALGQTVAPVLHKLTIPVLVVPSRG
jgi:manganese transport protein